MLRLDGKVALVTGCGSMGEGWGNGKAIAVLFARQGASVYGVDMSLAAAEATRAIIAGGGGIAEVSEANVTVAADIEKMAERRLRHWQVGHQRARLTRTTGDRAVFHARAQECDRRERTGAVDVFQHVPVDRRDQGACARSDTPGRWKASAPRNQLY